MKHPSVRSAFAALSAALFTMSAMAQATAPATPANPPPSTTEPAQQEQAVPKGTVLFQSQGGPPEVPADPSELRTRPGVAKPSGPELAESERSALTVTSYDLDGRLTPSTSRLAMRARLTLRNDGAGPLTRIALQISSTLQWESVALVGANGTTKLEFGQHLLDTDADHTSRANEAVAVLPSPLPPGQSVVVATFYSGTIAISPARLERIGASEQQALEADWDSITAGHIALRGFGTVLWYPVAAKQVFLGEGAQLFEAIGRMQQREMEAKVRLHVGIEYAGNPPVAVYFCGRRQALSAVSDDPEAPVASGTGIATADFPAQPLGFRQPSLFVVEHAETMLAPEPLVSSSSSSSSSASPQAEELPAAARGPALLAVESDDTGALTSLAGSAQRVAPLLVEWFGAQPLSALTIIDQQGQPFEDGPLLVAPVGTLATSVAQPALAHSLTHAWVQTGVPWMDEGLAQFVALLWTERESGRDAAALQLQNLLQPLGISEPLVEQGKVAPAGQPLTAATSEIFFRRKAAAVWWMLRRIVGDKPLQAALQVWRTRGPAHEIPEQTALAFEAMLEKTSGKDLHWFFDDWVTHDRGLPDLSITDVTPRQLPAGQGHGVGWLVSVSVRNDGAAAAEVPVTVRSGSLSATSSLRVAGFGDATARVVVEALPTEVSLNDGNTPEISAWKHTRPVVLPAK